MLLEVRDLTKVYDTGFVKVNALKGISFKLIGLHEIKDSGEKI